MKASLTIKDMSEQTKCHLCGSHRYAVIYKTYSGNIAKEEKAYKITEHSTDTQLQIVRCKECDLVYLHPLPLITNLEHNYIRMLDEDYIKEEKGRRLSAQFILKELKKYKKCGRLLDIGCATGFLLDEARKQGWQVYGIELSNWAVDFAKNRLGIENIFQGTLNDANYSDNFFDVVVIKDTLEHLIDIKGILVEIKKILKPDGLLYISTPNFDSLASKIFRTKWWNINQSHIYYFTRKTLFKMLDLTGFRARETKQYGRIFTLEYWIDQYKNHNKTVYKFLMFLLKHKIIKNNLLGINFGDQLEVYATNIQK